jgi:hypothetical protein
MRLIAFTAFALLFAAPASAAPYLEQQDRANEPVGENWHERWQGRRHWLYDDIAQDTATQDTATDGHSANAQAICRNVPVRVKRSDGVTFARRINRCD